MIALKYLLVPVDFSEPSEVAVKYGVHAIPCPVLVDGDTGIILAEGPDALGHKLSRTGEKVLASKAKK